MARLYAGGRDPNIARLHIAQPYEIDSHEATTAEVRAWSRIFSFEDAREQLIDQGFDGVVFREGDYIEVVAFHPEQIESMGRHPSFEAAGASVIHLQPA